MTSISEFLGAFYPDSDEHLWLLGFPSKGLPDGHADKHAQRKRRVTRNELANDRQLQASMKADNQHMGVYFVVNAGGTEKKDISRVNAIFCEIDEIPMNEQHELYDRCEVMPSIRTETKKSVHAYWLLNESMSVEQFIALQNGLIMRFGADPKIKNENRVMRLPHFNHISYDGEYVFKKVLIHTFNPAVRYSTFELCRAFPYTAPKQPKYITDGYAADTWEGVKNELRFRISQLPSYRVESNRTWATAKGVCHNGNNNTALTVNLRTGVVSCKAECSFDQILGSFGLSKPEKKVSRIDYVPARPQSGWLHDAMKQRQIEADERDAIQREGCGEYRDLEMTFDPSEFDQTEALAA